MQMSSRSLHRTLEISGLLLVLAALAAYLLTARSLMHRLRGTSRSEPAGDIERVTLSFDLPAVWVKRGANLLEIRSSTWNRAQASDSKDRRPLGIMPDTVTFEPVSSI